MQAKYDLAVPNYKQAIELKKDLAHPYNGLGMVSSAQGDYTQSVKYLDQAIGADKEFTSALVNRAIVSLFANGIADAIGDLQKAIVQLEPNGKVEAQIEIHCLLGAVLMAARRVEDAEAEFKIAIRLNAANALPHIGLGLLYASNGKLSESFKSLEKAYGLEPNAPELYLVRGNANFTKGNFGDAARDFNYAVMLVPNSPQGALGRGIARLALGDPDAKADLDAAERLSRDPIEISIARLWKCLITKGKECVRQALYPVVGEKEKQNPFALAQVYWLSGHVDDAIFSMNDPIEGYSRAVEVDPCSTRSLLDRASLLEERDDKEGAITDYNKAVDCGRDNISAYLMREAFYRKQGRNELALRDIQEVLTFHSAGCGAHRHWAYPL